MAVSPSPDAPSPATSSSHKRPEWLFWALGSGAFAALNGVFAKLTTGTATEAIVTSLSRFLGISPDNHFFEYIIRAIFFAFNQVSNAIMWILFTRALTAATSTTRVSILNTSANFMITGILGLIIFGESLPLGWWAGAVLVLTGSVIIGTREEKQQGRDGAQHGRSDANVTDNVGLREADTVAKSLGAGGIEEAVLAAGGRFRDDPHKDSDSDEVGTNER